MRRRKHITINGIRIRKDVLKTGSVIMLLSISFVALSYFILLRRQGLKIKHNREQARGVIHQKQTNFELRQKARGIETPSMTVKQVYISATQEMADFVRQQRQNNVQSGNAMLLSENYHKEQASSATGVLEYIPEFGKVGFSVLRPFELFEVYP